MGTRKGFKTDAGTTWEDVKEAMVEFKEEFACELDIRVRARKGVVNDRTYLRVTAVAEHGPFTSLPCWRREYSLDWPTYGSRTMAGLYLRLVYEFAESLRLRPPVPGNKQASIASPLS